MKIIFKFNVLLIIIFSFLFLSLKAHASSKTNLPLGFGINVLTGSGEVVGGSPIFTNINENNIYYMDKNSDSYDSYALVGIDNLILNLKSNANIGSSGNIGYSLFSGSVINKFSISNELSKKEYSETVFLYKSYNRIDKRVYLYDYNNYDYYSKYLSSNFLSSLDRLNSNITDDNILSFLNQFGTNVIMSGNLGYSAKIWASYYNSKYDIKDEASVKTCLSNSLLLTKNKVSFDLNMNLNSSYNLNYEYENGSEKSEIHAECIGKDKAILLNEKSSLDCVNTWLKDSSYKETFIGCDLSGCVPIYNYFPSKYNKLALIVKKYLEQEDMLDISTYDFKSNVIYNCKEEYDSFDAGGGKYTTYKAFSMFDSFENLHKKFSKMDINVSFTSKKGTSDQPYISIWNNTIYISMLSEEKLKGTQNKSITLYNVPLKGNFIDSKNESRYLNLSGNSFTIKFDAFGIWKYNISDLKVSVKLFV